MKQETKVAIMKVVIGFGAGLAVATVVGATIKGIVPVASMTRINRVIFKVGLGLIGAMTADVASDYTDGIVDDIRTMVKAVKTSISSARNEFA
jgi:thiamine monophosphate kinase